MIEADSCRFDVGADTRKFGGVPVLRADVVRAFILVLTEDVSLIEVQS
jgi:hypothetical protein